MRTAVAYTSSRGPSYRVSTRYFCALAGEGRWYTIISSSATLAGSQFCITRFIRGLPISSLSSVLSLLKTPSFSSMGNSFALLSFIASSMTCLMGS